MDDQPMPIEDRTRRRREPRLESLEGRPLLSFGFGPGGPHPLRPEFGEFQRGPEGLFAPHFAPGGPGLSGPMAFDFGRPGPEGSHDGHRYGPPMSVGGLVAPAVRIVLI